MMPTGILTLLTIGIAFIASVTFGAERIPLRFDELPDLVSSANGLVQGARNVTKATEERTGHLKRSFLPTLRAWGGGETFQTGSYSLQTQPFGSIEAKVNLFNSGRDALEDRRRDHETTQSKAEEEETYFRELSEARKAYWELVFLKESLALVRSSVQQNEKNSLAAIKRIKSGLATQSDRLEFEISRFQLSQEIARHELEISQTERKISALIGRPLSTQFDTEALVPHHHDDAILEETFEPTRHRELRGLLAQQGGHDIFRAQAQRWWAPSLDLYGTYSLYTFRDRDQVSITDRFETVIGARLTFELFDGLQSRSEANAAAYRSFAVDAQIQQSSRELAARAENAKQELRSIHTLIHEGELSVEKGLQYLNLSLSEYSRGVKNSLDVLSATQKHLELRRRYAQLRRDYQLARVELLALLGK